MDPCPWRRLNNNHNSNNNKEYASSHRKYNSLSKDRGLAIPQILYKQEVSLSYTRPNAVELRLQLSSVRPSVAAWAWNRNPFSRTHTWQ
jgi:hypothetical protein